MLEILQFEFMQRALIGGTIIAIVAPLIGQFLVVRRYSLLADTLAHVSLAGVALGLLFNVQPILSALVVAILAAIGIERLRHSEKLAGEAILALFLSGGLALAVVLISLANGFNANLFSFLFGSLTTVGVTDLIVMSVLGVAIIALISLLYHRLFYISYDEPSASASGIPAHGINILFIILAAITVALSIRIVGALLIGALMVIPVLAAMQWRQSFARTLGIGIGFSLLSVIGGLVLSFYFDLATGGTIVLVALVLFLLSLLAHKK